MQNVTTKLRFTFLWYGTTTELTATGAWSALILAASDASGTGYGTIGTLSPMIESMSTFFNRYRVNKVSAKFCGLGSGTVTDAILLKFVPEAITSAAESSDWYNYTEGQDVAWHVPGQTNISELHVSKKSLDKTGIAWKDCNSAVDDLGAWGTVLLLTSASTAAAFFVPVTVEMEFAELTDPDISFALGGKKGFIPHQALLRLKRLTIPRDLVVIEDDGKSAASGDVPARRATVQVEKACLPPRRRLKGGDLGAKTGF